MILRYLQSSDISDMPSGRIILQQFRYVRFLPSGRCHALPSRTSALPSGLGRSARCHGKWLCPKPLWKELLIAGRRITFALTDTLANEACCFAIPSPCRSAARLQAEQQSALLPVATAPGLVDRELGPAFAYLAVPGIGHYKRLLIINVSLAGLASIAQNALFQL